MSSTNRLSTLCTGLVLAGGQGQRMGGQDKGLLPWQGGVLAAHAAQRLGATGMPVQVSANRNLEAYRALGFPVVEDRRSGFHGPLAALEAGLQAITTPWLLAVPCDSPFFPEDLGLRLWSALEAAAATPGQPPLRAVHVRCGAQPHPVFCLMARELAPELGRFLDAGGRRVRDWWQSVAAAAVDFGEGAQPAFANANTPEDYGRLRARADREIPAC